MKKENKSELIGANVVFLANPGSPKKLHVYVNGRVESVETQMSMIKYKAPNYGKMTSGWFLAEHIYYPLGMLDIR